LNIIIKAKTPNVKGIKNLGRLLGFPDENIESFEDF
jgi:hypothetical protein